MVPVELTLEPGVDYRGGVLPPPTPLDWAERTAPKDRVVLAPRERHTPMTLAALGTPGPALAAGEGHDLLELLAHDNTWYAQSPEDALRVVASSELLADAVDIERRKEEVRRGLLPHTIDTAAAAAQQQPVAQRLQRLVFSDVGALTQTPAQQAQQFVDRGLVTAAEAQEMMRAASDEARLAGKRMTSGERSRLLYERDRAARELRYFATDEELDADVPFGADPAAYPMMQRLLEQYGPRFDDRRNLSKDLLAAPRKPLDVCSRRYLDDFRYDAPPGGQWRPCSLADTGMCRFQVMARDQGVSHYAYAAREFLTPTQLEAWKDRRRRGIPVSEAADGPRGLCIDDLLYSWSVAVHFEAANKAVPLEPLNTFTVRCEEGEFDLSCMLKNVIDGRKTGIQGHVPTYNTHARQYETRTFPPIKPDGPPRPGMPFLALVGQGFWRGLSEANACLGIRKIHPLVPADLPRFYRLPSRALAARVCSPAAAAAVALLGPAWQRFLDGMPSCVLADRALLALGEGRTRVPAALLRPTLPLDTRHVRAIPSLAQALAALLGGDGDTVVDELVDAALAPFDVSVARWAQAMAAERFGFALGPLAALLGPDATWRQRLGNDWAYGLPLPTAIHAAFASGNLALMADAILDHPPERSYVLWLVCLWRCAVAWLLVDVVLQVPADAPLRYQARLFGDTHLDLLTLGLVRGRGHVGADDALLLAEQGALLARLYPQANRVCCFEELPSLASGGLLYGANPWYDKGNKKAQKNIAHVIEHLFVHKLRPQVCQRRSFHDILIKHCREYPAVRELVGLVMRVVALGNLPRASAPLPLVARLRVNASLSPHFALTTAARLEAWIDKYRMLTLFLLREFFLALVEADAVFDAFWAQSSRWAKFKALVRFANGDWRQDMAAQTAAKGPFVPLDWSAFERGATAAGQRAAAAVPAKKPRVDRTGRMVAYHDKTSAMNTKLKKGYFFFIDVLIRGQGTREGRLGMELAHRHEPGQALRGRFEPDDVPIVHVHDGEEFFRVALAHAALELVDEGLVEGPERGREFGGKCFFHDQWVVI